MATRKSTSRQKTVKADIKLSAPVDNTVSQIGGAGGWIIGPQPSPLGEGLLNQFKRALGAHIVLQGHSVERAADAFDSAQRFARTMALVPPKGAAEALAAAIFLFDEASDIDQANTWNEDRCREWSLRMQQRASALADWIETTHKIDRKDWNLDYFCNGDTSRVILPHTAPVINVNAPGGVVKTP